MGAALMTPLSYTPACQWNQRPSGPGSWLMHVSGAAEPVRIAMSCVAPTLPW